MVPISRSSLRLNISPLRLSLIGSYTRSQKETCTSLLKAIGEVAWVDENLEGFKGRVSRDRWVEQARELAAGAPAGGL